MGILISPLDPLDKIIKVTYLSMEKKYKNLERMVLVGPFGIIFKS